MQDSRRDVDYNSIVLKDGALVIVAGAALVLLADSLAPLTGWPSTSAIRTIGLVLALYGAGLARQARSQPQDPRLPKSAAAINLVFAAASLLVPLLLRAPLTPLGWGVVALFALVAAGFAVAQLRIARR